MQHSTADSQLESVSGQLVRTPTALFRATQPVPSTCIRQTNLRVRSSCQRLPSPGENLLRKQGPAFASGSRSKRGRRKEKNLHRGGKPPIPRRTPPSRGRTRAPGVHSPSPWLSGGCCYSWKISSWSRSCLCRECFTWRVITTGAGTESRAATPAGGSSGL